MKEDEEEEEEEVVQEEEGTLRYVTNKGPEWKFGQDTNKIFFCQYYTVSCIQMLTISLSAL